MKLLIWGVTVFLALLWTGGAAMLAAALDWLAATSLDPALRGAEALAKLPLPEWLVVWLPPGGAELLRLGTSEIMTGLAAAAGWLVPMLGWLTPLVWLLWGFVMVLMLVVAGGAHYLLARGKFKLG